MALPSTPSPDPIRAWLAAVMRGGEPGALPPDEAVDSLVRGGSARLVKKQGQVELYLPASAPDPF